MQERTFQFRGTILDLPPDEAGEDYWTSVTNMKFVDRATQRIWGYEEFYSAAGEYPVFAYPVLRRAQPLWIILVFDGTDTVVYRWTGSIATRIDTGQWAGIDATIIDWQATDHNGVIVLNGSYTRTPVYWDESIPGPAGAGELKDLPGWPLEVTCKSIRSYKYHLFALGLKNLTQENPYEWMNSAASEPNQIPQTWVADPSNDAGNNQIASPQGFIVDGIVLRDSLLILKDFSCHPVTYIGGTFVFSQRSLYISSGMMNNRCAVEINGNAIIATQDDIILTDGNSMDSICTHEVRKYIFASINPDRFQYCQMVKRHLYDEIWFAYPKGQDKFCTEAAIYNVRTKRWGFVSLPDVTCLSYGLIPDPEGNETWDERSNAWDADPERWDERAYSNASDEIVMCQPFDAAGSYGKVFVNNRGATFDGEAIKAEAKREGLLMEGNPESWYYINELWPQIEGRTGDTIQIQAGAARNEGDPVSWIPAIPYVIGSEQGKIDLHVPGRWFAFRFYSSGGFPWRMYNFRVRYKRKGRF